MKKKELLEQYEKMVKLQETQIYQEIDGLKKVLDRLEENLMKQSQYVAKEGLIMELAATIERKCIKINEYNKLITSIKEVD